MCYVLPRLKGTLFEQGTLNQVQASSPYGAIQSAFEKVEMG
jgi:hypothetical protein